MTVEELETLEPETLELPLSELLRAHRNGFHLVVIERNTAEFLIHKVSLSGSDKALLKRLHQQFTQNGRLHERAPVYIEVNVGGDAIKKEGRCFRVPLNFIGANTFGAPSQLLTEDANYDAKLINFILRSVRDVSGAPTFSFVEEHGGGASTLQRYISGLCGKKIGICIMDTDRKSPFADICGITKQAITARGESNWPLFDVVPLPCHELENVVPHTVVSTLNCAAGCEWNSKIPRIENWERLGRKSENEAFWLFFDVKRGLSHVDVELLSEKEVAWVQPRLNVLGTLPAGWTYPGYGKSVVAQLLDNNRALDAFRKAIRHSAWQRIFVQYFVNIIWVGAASGIKLNT